MAIKTRNLISLLAIISVSTTIAAIYYGYTSYRLKNRVSELRLEGEKNKENNEEYNAVLKELDSLLLKEEYESAEVLSKKIESLETYNAYPDLKIRTTLIHTLVESGLHKAAAAKERALSNVLTAEHIKIHEDLPKDSLILALQAAQSKINSLQNRPRPTSSNGYLKFKTSKGTPLHYVGQVKGQKANGFGIALLETGSRYEGNWKNNMRHGKGKFYWNDGEHYEGSYQNDKRHGTGTYFWENGEKYVGEWADDQRNGQGKFYNKKGKIKASGVWEKDKLSKEDKS